MRIEHLEENVSFSNTILTKARNYAIKNLTHFSAKYPDNIELAAYRYRRRAKFAPVGFGARFSPGFCKDDLFMVGGLKRRVSNTGTFVLTEIKADCCFGE